MCPAIVTHLKSDLVPSGHDGVTHEGGVGQQAIGSDDSLCQDIRNRFTTHPQSPHNHVKPRRHPAGSHIHAVN